MEQRTILRLAGRTVGPGHPCFIIAEAGVNHNGDPLKALRLVDVAQECGADAVKFQTFCSETLLSKGAPKSAYQHKTTSLKESQLAMLKRLELSPEAHQRLVARAKQKGILFLSSPFDEASAVFLRRLGVAAFKIASGQITNLPFLARVAAIGRPVILSTGMSTLAEVERAVRVFEQAGNNRLLLLHCVTSYPAPPAEINLRAMETLRMAFGLPVGYSDHCMGTEAALAAVALGACVIEKHFTLSRRMKGPDHASSSEPRALAELVRAVRNVEAALGDGAKRPMPSELENRVTGRGSLVTAEPLPRGCMITKKMLCVKRPATGIEPHLMECVLGRRTKTDVPQDTVLQWSHLA